jgi:pyruvate kinase
LRRLPFYCILQKLQLQFLQTRANPCGAETAVANAVLDGTDCVMLGGETVAGAYPEIVVQTIMNKRWKYSKAGG